MRTQITNARSSTAQARLRARASSPRPPIRRSDLQRPPRGRHHERRIIFPVHAGNVDVELDLVTVRIAQIQRVGDDVIGQAVDRRAGRDDRVAPEAMDRAGRDVHEVAGRERRPPIAGQHFDLPLDP
jgi:hypothetical protein